MTFSAKYFLYLGGKFSNHHNQNQSFPISGFAYISLVLSLAEAAGPHKGRMLNVLEVIRFPNDPCTVGNENISGIVAQDSLIYLEFNSQNPGVCYTATECSALGGTLGSACASGFGVCCTFSGQTQHSIM